MKTRVVHGGWYDEALGVGRCVDVGVGVHIACPLAMLLNLGEVLLLDELVFDVSQHGGRARPQAPH